MTACVNERHCQAKTTLKKISNFLTLSTGVTVIMLLGIGVLNPRQECNLNSKDGQKTCIVKILR